MENIVSSTKELFKIRFLRNVLLVAAVGTISMPLIERFAIYPLFSNYLVSTTQESAIRIANHLALELDVRPGSLTVDSIPTSLNIEAEELLSTLGISKIKIFSPLGQILFSTKSVDIGTINEKAYFHQKVAKGNVFTLLVQKEQMTAEGEIATADMVETYIPLFNPDGEFAGAFEIYLEITDRWVELKDLVFWSAMGMTLAVAMILAALFFALLRAAQVTVERQRAQIKLQLAADVMANAEEGILVTDANGCIESVNRAFTEVTGYTQVDVLGKDPNFLQSGRHNKQFFQNMWDSIKREGMWQGEIWNRRKNGAIYPEWLSITAIKDDKGVVANYVAMFHDITHFKVKESQLEALAYRDALTGLPNRHLIKDRIEQSLVAAKRGGIKSAVLFLDLDGFKTVNDSNGHNVGDALLQEVAKRFQVCIREEDTLGRIGGDEFLICIRKVEQISEVKLVAKRLINCLEKRELLIEGHHCSMSVSIGVSFYPEHGEDVETLIHCADIAMYAAKDAGKKGYRIYDSAMEKKYRKRSR